METKDVILELRTKKGLSQDELAEKVYVTRPSSISLGKWRNNPQYRNAKITFRFFDVSINTLLGSP